MIELARDKWPPGEVLFRYREQAGLTQKQVALRLGRPQSFVSKYESGERGLSVQEFVLVCQIVGADVSEAIQEVAI